MFSKCYITVIVPLTLKLLFAFMSCLMSSQSRTGREGPVTILPSAFVVTNIRVSTLLVSFEMVAAHKVFVAILDGTFERTFVAVRAKVFF